MLNAEILAARVRGIGGSDAAVACGLSPYKTPRELWAEKTGRVTPEDISDKPAVHFGNVLEDVVRQEYIRRTGTKVHRVNRMIASADHPFMLANIDGRCIGTGEGFEAKTASPWASKEFGEDGTDEVPTHYLLQCAHYMSVTGWSAWNLAVLIGGNDFRTYRIERDDALIASLIEREREFWNFVEMDTPPPPSNVDDIVLLHPRDSGLAKAATPDLIETLAELRETKASIAELEKRQKEFELRVKGYMEDASELTDGAGTTLATWRSQTQQRFDSSAFQKALPDLAREYKKETTFRRFSVK